MKYKYMGNEIADKAAQVALNHDLPHFLQMRHKMRSYHESAMRTWEEIFHSLYVVGTKFADHFRALPEDAPINSLPSQDLDRPLNNINLKSLGEEHGTQILKGCVWGATYMAALYSYLQQLEWTAQDHETTQWVEL